MKPKPIIERIEEVLKLKRLNQKRFCEMLGVESSYFSNWKKRGFPSARLSQAASALDMTLDELTSGTDMEATQLGKHVVEQHVINEHRIAYSVKRVIDNRMLHLFNVISSGIESKQIDSDDIQLLEKFAKRMMKK